LIIILIKSFQRVLLKRLNNESKELELFAGTNTSL